MCAGDCVHCGVYVLCQEAYEKATKQNDTGQDEPLDCWEINDCSTCAEQNTCAYADAV